MKIFPLSDLSTNGDLWSSPRVERKYRRVLNAGRHAATRRGRRQLIRDRCIRCRRGRISLDPLLGSPPNWGRRFFLVRIILPLPIVCITPHSNWEGGGGLEYHQSTHYSQLGGYIPLAALHSPSHPQCWLQRADRTAG